MTQHPAGSGRQPRFGKTRAAAVGFGLGATLALSPLVWAQNPSVNAPRNTPAPNATPPLSQGAPTLPQQSFAPLVKRVLPAVVNISVTEQSGTEMMGYDTPDHSSRRFRGMPEQFRGSPFEDFMRRFFDNDSNNTTTMTSSALRGRSTKARTAAAAGGSRSGRASSSIPPGSSSPTTTSSPNPRRLRSCCRTTADIRRACSAATRAPTSPC